MPADISQRQRQLQQQQQQIQSDIETQRSSAEMYEEGSTLDNDKAIGCKNILETKLFKI